MPAAGLSLARIGRVVTVSLAVLWTASPTMHGQTTQRAASEVPTALRPTCGTRALTDVEIAADAARVAAFKARHGAPKASTLLTITTFVHVCPRHPEWC